MTAINSASAQQDVKGAQQDIKHAQHEANNIDKSIDFLQILSFELDKAWFGIEIASIQEVLEYRNVTKVPRTPDYMLGVINLRGKVIPVVDLRRQFAMHLSEPSQDSCIIIIQVDIEGEPTALGIMADCVQEVVEIAQEDINPPPRIGNKIDVVFINGMAKQDDNFIILLNVSRLFGEQEFETLVEKASDSSGIDEATVAAGQESPAITGV